MTAASEARPRPWGEKIALGIMLLRGVLYFLLRMRPPRLVLMDRGARIRGLSSIHFRGPAKIGAYALLDARHCGGVTLGRNFSLGDFSILRASGSHAFRCPEVTIGDHVTFGPYCNIGGGYGLRIGDHCIYGPYVSIHPEEHVTTRTDVPIRTQGVTGRGIEIARDSWVGAKATVLDGARIGPGSIVAAAALVRRGEYEGMSVLAGVPAREIGKR